MFKSTTNTCSECSVKNKNKNDQFLYSTLPQVSQLLPGGPAEHSINWFWSYVVILLLFHSSERKAKLHKLWRQLDCCEFTPSPVCLNSRARNLLCQFKHHVAAGPAPAPPDFCHQSPFHIPTSSICCNIPPLLQQSNAQNCWHPQAALPVLGFAHRISFYLFFFNIDKSQNLSQFYPWTGRDWC